MERFLSLIIAKRDIAKECYSQSKIEWEKNNHHADFVDMMVYEKVYKAYDDCIETYKCTKELEGK